MPNNNLSPKERREHPRHPIEAQVTVLFPEFWLEKETEELWGWTHNISAEGVCFSINCRLPSQELVLHVDYLGMGAEFILVKVVRQSPDDGGWRYHCHVERTLSTIGAMECAEI